MQVDIRIQDYLTEDEIKEIVKEELAAQVRGVIRTYGLERIITNSAYKIIFKAIDEQINEDLGELITKKSIEVIERLDNWHVFRRKDHILHEEDSKAYIYLQQAIEKNKEVLFERVRQIFSSIDEEILKDRVTDLIYTVIEDRLLGNIEG